MLYNFSITARRLSAIIFALSYKLPSAISLQAKGGEGGKGAKREVVSGKEALHDLIINPMKLEENFPRSSLAINRIHS